MKTLNKLQDPQFALKIWGVAFAAVCIIYIAGHILFGWPLKTS